LMGACGYRAFENTCRKLTQRQLRALGCQPDPEDGRYYPPSDSTFQRVFSKTEAGPVAAIIGSWLAEQEIGALARLAVDGKVLRGSGRHDGKPLLKKLALPPSPLITADAMHCQQESARFITQELGGDYLFGLKGNQSGILERAQHLLAQQGFPPSGCVGQGARTD
ncbi:MAG: hypothetical protein ACYDC1_18150, partial [Limisphaerales bacterium]